MNVVYMGWSRCSKAHLARAMDLHVSSTLSLSTWPNTLFLIVHIWEALNEQMILNWKLGFYAIQTQSF